MWLNATSEEGGIKGSATSPSRRAAGGAEIVEGRVARKALETLSKVSLILIMVARTYISFGRSEVIVVSSKMVIGGPPSE